MHGQGELRPGISVREKVLNRTSDQVEIEPLLVQGHPGLQPRRPSRLHAHARFLEPDLTLAVRRLEPRLGGPQLPGERLEERPGGGTSCLGAQADPFHTSTGPRRLGKEGKGIGQRDSLRLEIDAHRRTGLAGVEGDLAADGQPRQGCAERVQPQKPLVQLGVAGEPPNAQGRCSKGVHPQLQVPVEVLEVIERERDVEPVPRRTGFWLGLAQRGQVQIRHM